MAAYFGQMVAARRAHGAEDLITALVDAEIEGEALEDQEVLSLCTLLLIVKVAETSAEFDRTVELPLYAKGGIPEVWLVNVTEDRIELFRDPHPDGYQTYQVVSKGQPIVPFAFPNFTIATDAILG